MPDTEPNALDDLNWHTAGLDVRLDGFEAADEQTANEYRRQIGLDEPSLVPLAEHHTVDGVHSFYVLRDSSATYGFPGIPQYAALYLQRDLVSRTFRFEQARLPLPAMVQSWLIHRGCPPQSIVFSAEPGRPTSADVATRVLERRLMGDGDHFALGYSYTRDDPNDPVVVAALRALDGRASSPFRVVVRETDPYAWTYTLREGGFATVHEALQWCDDRLQGQAGPLPPVSAPASPNRPTLAPKAPAPRPPGRSR
ncbi:hypothetical protein [Streptomyces sp. bgisy084]|uniref:hypothetical protein n=1 Tax=unclassified Streptomyces TaxID=2593676 RepID=UPI003D744139